MRKCQIKPRMVIICKITQKTKPKQCIKFAYMAYETEHDTVECKSDEYCTELGVRPLGTPPREPRVVTGETAAWPCLSSHWWSSHSRLGKKGLQRSSESRDSES